jgi:site-specific DNA recombinase
VRSVSADKIEMFVVERVRQIGRDPALVQDTIEAVLASRAGDEPVLHSEKIRLEHQLAALRGEAKQLVANLREAKSDGSRAILERLSETELRTGQIERRLAEIAEASAAIEAKPITREAITRALRDFDPAWKGLVPREQASLLALLIESIVYDGAQGEVAITWRPSGIATLAGEVAEAGANSGVGRGRGKSGRGGRVEGSDDQASEESAA